LAGDIDFEALGNVPLPLAPDGCREWSLHDHIVSQDADAGPVRQCGRVGHVSALSSQHPDDAQAWAGSARCRTPPIFKHLHAPGLA
jgi:hypothetical protein